MSPKQIKSALKLARRTVLIASSLKPLFPQKEQDQVHEEIRFLEVGISLFIDEPTEENYERITKMTHNVNKLCQPIVNLLKDEVSNNCFITWKGN